MRSFVADLDAPRKQRHTITRIFDRLTFGGNIIETGTDSYRLAHTLRSRDHPHDK